MRLLAKELHISVITTKRAYEELEREGYILSVTGKGSFVATQNKEFLKETYFKQIEAHLSEAIKLAVICKLSSDTLKEMLLTLFEDQ